VLYGFRADMPALNYYTVYDLSMKRHRTGRENGTKLEPACNEPLINLFTARR